MLKKLFHTYNSILLILYLYPGSILGFLLYKDFYKQPQLTSDFLSISISSNHFYAFLLLAFLGFNSYKSKINTCENCGAISLGLSEKCTNCGAELNYISKIYQSDIKPSESTIEVKAEEIK